MGLTDAARAGLGAKLAEAFGASGVATMATLTVRSGSDWFGAFERIPAKWQFQRTGATGRERSRTDRTQEVAGSSPASSIESPGNPGDSGETDEGSEVGAR